MSEIIKSGRVKDGDSLIVPGSRLKVPAEKHEFGQLVGVLAKHGILVEREQPQIANEIKKWTQQ